MGMEIKKIHILSVLFVAIVLFVIAVVYLYNQDEVGRRTDLVGDGICGNFLDGESRDNCCIQVHADDTVECVGKWRYIDGVDECTYICASFNEDEQVACLEAEGEWKTFSNGCVDSCALARNPEIILCIQTLTDGCECGENRCWNSETGNCEDN